MTRNQSIIAPIAGRPAPLGRALRVVRNAGLIAIPFGLFYGLFTSNLPYWRSFLNMYGIAVGIGLSIGFLAWAVDASFERRGFREVPTSGPGLVGSIALFYVIGMVGSQVPILIVNRIWSFGMYETWRTTLISLGFSLLFTTLFFGLIYARYFHSRLIEKEKAEERARTELARAELRALRAQIHPHFLFNTLNTIAALIPHDPAQAENVTTRLADIFRFALHASEREWIPLAEELEFVHAYCEIERARFGERLRVEERVDPAALAVLVPSLLLQPLVENAIRHGLAGRVDGGCVRVAAALDGGEVVLRVEDDGVGFDPATRAGRARDGFGLRSVEDRVRAIGHGARLDIVSNHGGGTRITLRLPIHPPAPLAPS
jgi:sensor histidine kinase YesM